jgi:mono/diheme cytochrome c family protein
MRNASWIDRRARSELTMAAMIAALALPIVAGCQAREAPRDMGVKEGALDTKDDIATPATAAVSVDRGKYLVSILACNDCHTPLVMTPQGPQPDMSRMLSGHPATLVMPPPPPLAPEAPWNWSGAATLTAFSGPWGISYAINLTPHPTTGLGAEVWTEEVFIKALKTGRHFGTSRPIMPPMPWPAYAQMTDDDLKSIYAYLRTLPPIDNLVPDYVPPPGGGPMGHMGEPAGGAAGATGPAAGGGTGH